MTPKQAKKMLAEAELVCPESTITAVIERLATEISAVVAGESIRWC